MALHEFAPTSASATILSHREKLPSMLTHVFPYEVAHVTSGLNWAEALLQQDPPWGLVVAFNHYSLRDFVDTARVLATSQVIRERPVLVPIAFHQHNPLVAKIGEYFDLIFSPIVIRDTVNKPGYDHVHRGQGLAKYVRDAAKVLAAGGVVPISLQEGRRPKLGGPEVPALSFFLKHMERQRVERVAILFVGLGLRGETDYSRPGVDKLNIGRLVEVKIGDAFTKTEATVAASSVGQSLDQWAYAQIRPLVPEAYR